MYNKRTFFRWLTVNQGLAESTSHTYTTHINKAERFAKLYNLGAKRLFDVVDSSQVEMTIDALMRNEAFFIKNKARYNSIKTALRKYLCHVSNDTAVFPESNFKSRPTTSQNEKKHTKSAIISISRINPKDVVKWLITQPNAKGSLYLKNVVQHYMRHLRSAPAKLDIQIPLNKRDVFSCQTVVDLDDLWNAFKRAPNYTIVNRGTGASLSAGYSAYRRYLSYLEDRSERDVNAKHSMPHKNSLPNDSIGNFEGLDNLFSQLHDRLQLKEKEHRTAYGIASDNNDWDAVDRESEIALRISKWRKELENLRVEIKESGYFEKDVNTSNSYTISDDEFKGSESLDGDIKIGKYIREKLRELSKSGFNFSQEQIENLTDVDWGKMTFSYYYSLPFAKVVTDIDNISTYIKDTKGQNRYWSEPFTFGQHKLIFFSQWFERDRENFNNWYSSLINEPITSIPEDKEWEDAFFNESEANILQNNQQSLFDFTIQEHDTNTRPSIFSLFRRQYPVTGWSDLYHKVCEILILYRPYVMASLAVDSVLNADEQVNFSYIESEIRHTRRALTNGMWIETNKNAEEVLRICFHLLDKCGYSHDDLVIKTEEDSE